MLGSVFSPYYARARRRGRANALDHSALNVALYGERGSRWSLTERRQPAVRRSARRLEIGPSSLEWQGEELVARIHELGVPLPRRLRGEVRIRPTAIFDADFILDEPGGHRWHPIAPCARIEVDLAFPRRRWSGAAYIDGNSGDVALERSFRRWHWSRSIGPRATTVLYDIERRSAAPLSLALRFDAGGAVAPFAAPALAPLPRSAWRIERATRSDDGTPPRVLRTLEDTPFYARSMVESRVHGEALTSVHESLSLERFGTRWVQTLIPFRMPRSPW